MKRRHGAIRYFIGPKREHKFDVQGTKRTFASSNMSRGVFSDSPDMSDTIESAGTLMKDTVSS